jgi:hypothetical protein
MATVLKRLLTVGLVLGLIIGATAQPVPVSAAQPDVLARAEMPGGCAGLHAPCTGHMPICIDHICCVTVSALPTPVSTVTPVEWTSLDYDLAAESLTGISLKPELSPPILVA